MSAVEFLDSTPRVIARGCRATGSWCRLPAQEARRLGNRDRGLDATRVEDRQLVKEDAGPSRAAGTDPSPGSLLEVELQSGDERLCTRDDLCIARGTGAGHNNSESSGYNGGRWLHHQEQNASPTILACGVTCLVGGRARKRRRSTSALLQLPPRRQARGVHGHFKRTPEPLCKRRSSIPDGRNNHPRLTEITIAGEGLGLHAGRTRVPTQRRTLSMSACRCEAEEPRKHSTRSRPSGQGEHAHLPPPKTLILVSARPALSINTFHRHFRGLAYRDNPHKRLPGSA